MMRRVDILRAIGVVTLLALAVAAILWSNRPVASYSADGADFGYEPDPDGVRAFLATLAKPTFDVAAPDAYEKRQERDTFLFRAMDNAHKAAYGRPFVVGKQGIGDCVAWGAGHGIFCAESVAWQEGERAEPPLMPSMECIYGGSRVEARGRPCNGANPVGGYSDGSTGWAAAKWLRDWGVVYRQEVLGHDLREYSAERAKEFGAFGCGGKGDNCKLDDFAKKTPARHIVAVKTWDELVAAIGSGYPVTVASMVGFNSQRDADGFCVADRQWAHQMVLIGLRFAKNGQGTNPRDGALCLNSWGTSWVRGGKYPEDQPEGSFWIARPTVERMLRYEDSYAVGNVEAPFKFRELKHGEWLAPAPPQE